MGITEWPRRVLLVDDDKAAIDMYREYFEHKTEFEPVTALSAADALAVIEREDLDCVVTDSVTTSDGDPLVSITKQTRPTLPVVLYSGREPADLPTEDADAYLQKGTASATTSTLQPLEETIRDLLPDQPQESTHETVPDSAWQTLAVFDWTETSPSTALLGALGEQTAFEPLAASSLYQTLDPDAFDALLKSLARNETDARIHFEYAGLELAVSARGRVRYRHQRQSADTA